MPAAYTSIWAIEASTLCLLTGRCRLVRTTFNISRKVNVAETGKVVYLVCTTWAR